MTTPHQTALEPQRITCPTLSLAMYREVVTHLRQVSGVQADVIPQTSQQFAYEQSQIAGLWYAFGDAADDTSRQHVEMILKHYGDRFGSWQPFVSA